MVNEQLDRKNRVGVVFWYADDGLALGHVNRIRMLGHTAIPFQWDESFPKDLDLIFAYGPIKSMVPVLSQILDHPEGSRPDLAFMLTEQLPNPDLPEWFRLGMGKIKSRLDRVVFRNGQAKGWSVRSGFQEFVNRGRRYCYYGDLYWMRDAGVLKVLAVWSHWTAEYLRVRGFKTMVPSQGRNPDWGEDLHLKRDIPLLWLGKPGSKRRQRILKQLRVQLEDMGIPMLVIDGVEHPYVFDDERTRLLNRSKIVLNVLREKWDDNTLRFGLAVQNKALIVSETMLPHSSLKPGVHYVESPVDRLAETISYYLNNENERVRIADQAYEFLMSKTRGVGIEEILQKALADRQVGG
jgi:hypothetical protein